MESALIIILWTAALFLAVFINLAASPKLSRRIIGACAVITAIGGLIIYSSCFALLLDNPILSILRSAFCVCTLFLGENCFELISEASIMQHAWVEACFWVLQFMGVFAATGAAVSLIGSRFLHKLRLYLNHSKHLSIIYHISEDTVNYARELLDDPKNAVLFVDEAPDANCAEAIASLNCMLRSDHDAIEATERFIKSIGISPRRRHITLYALSDDEIANQMYAAAFLKSLEKRKIDPDKLSLTIIGAEDQTENHLLVSESSYGFGNVIAVNVTDMAARLLIHRRPPCDCIEFDAKGKALQDFHALVIGCGSAGQSVIKQLIMNGQFEGSHFRLTLFDPNYDEVMGKMLYECSELFQNYQIDVHRHDARSTAMYSFLAENLASLHYIAVSTGSDVLNNEIAGQLRHYLALQGSNLAVHLCSSRGVRVVGEGLSLQWDIYTSDVLSSEHIDRMAILLNQSYCKGNCRSAEENWRSCDYFSRMSSRASADYASAFLRMAHISADEAASGKWQPADKLLENMARSEHLRWCAFHYAMGFRAMTLEEYQERCDIYLAEKAAHGSTKYRIGKDLTKRIHCCLIPWDVLDELSECENKVTGGHVDYKQMDRDNVLALPDLLRACKEDL